MTSTNPEGIDPQIVELDEPSAVALFVVAEDGTGHVYYSLEALVAQFKMTLAENTLRAMALPDDDTREHLRSYLSGQKRVLEDIMEAHDSMVSEAGYEVSKPEEIDEDSMQTARRLFAEIMGQQTAQQAAPAPEEDDRPMPGMYL